MLCCWFIALCCEVHYKVSEFIEERLALLVDMPCPLVIAGLITLTQFG